MADDYKTLRVPEAAWAEAKEQKESAGRTWGEQIVRPDSDNDSTMPDGGLSEAVADLRADLNALAPDEIEGALATIETRTGRIERQLEDMQR